MRVQFIGFGLCAAFAGCNSQSNEVAGTFKAQEIVSPAGPGSSAPNLFVAGDGRIFLSWIERAGEKPHALRYSIYETGRWSSPQTIAEGQNWFVNWADFPSMTAFGDAAFAAHWLAKNGNGAYAYEIKIALSTDAGKSWRKTLTPHRDGTATEHGFVSMLPWGNDRLFVVWLDGRNFAKLANGHNDESDQDVDMMLRFAALDRNGDLHDEAILDARVCECCQTSAAITTNGAVVVYRDRSPQEIRDIGVVRFLNGRWTEPGLVHADNWEHRGCPVNGPAIAADGEFVAVAWYTEAQDAPHVRLAFSIDAGASFGQPIEVGDGEPMGRVDLILLPDRTALVCWLEQTDSGGDIRVRRVRADGWRGQAFTLAPSSPQRASGFPRLARNDGEIVFAWTQSDGNSTAVRAAAAKLNGGY